MEVREELRIETAGSITGQPKSGGKVSEFIALLGVKPGLGEPEKVACFLIKAYSLPCPQTGIWLGKSLSHVQLSWLCRVYLEGRQ